MEFRRITLIFIWTLKLILTSNANPMILESISPFIRSVPNDDDTKGSSDSLSQFVPTTQNSTLSPQKDLQQKARNTCYDSNQCVPTSPSPRSSLSEVNKLWRSLSDDNDSNSSPTTTWDNRTTDSSRVSPDSSNYNPTTPNYNTRTSRYSNPNSPSYPPTEPTYVPPVNNDIRRASNSNYNPPTPDYNQSYSPDSYNYIPITPSYGS